MDKYCTALEHAREDEIASLLKKIDIEALENRATTLRNGEKCRVIVPQLRSQTLTRSMGRCNFHLEIRFEDGTR
jgi:hypothetical protein